MEHIATAALVVIAICAVMLTRSLIEFINTPRTSLTVTLCQKDRDLLADWRRRKPKAKEIA